LSDLERDQIALLIRQFADDPQPIQIGHNRNVLAILYRMLPASRHRLSTGLGREARSVEEILGERGGEKRSREPLTKLAEQLIAAGLAAENEDILSASMEHELQDISDVAGRLIDLVMAAGRLNCPIPINLLMRAAVTGTTQTELSTIVRLFKGLDLFRWRRFENEGEELLISPRLVLEADLICRRRLINATGEGIQLVKLIKAVRLSWDAGGAERRFLSDLLHSLGPDGPLGSRYRNTYLDAARALTGLRISYGINDPSLMLQEAVLRRSAIRENVVSVSDHLSVLEEAREAVQAGVDFLAGQTGRGARHARSNLSVERAAIYGFLATYRAHQSAPPQEIWSAYQTARTATHAAVAINETYYPLDISLWVPADLIEALTLPEHNKLELLADIHSMLDQIDPETFSREQRERFYSRLLVLGNKLKLPELSDVGFSALEAEGSTAGYYLRARTLGPALQPDQDRAVNSDDRSRAAKAAAFLRTHWQRIAGDYRCLRYLLECEWTVAVGQRLFRGERGALPSRDYECRELLKLVKALRAVDPNAGHNISYLEAVLSWLNNEEQYASQSCL
jgi:hypothetical protein